MKRFIPIVAFTGLIAFIAISQQSTVNSVRLTYNNVSIYPTNWIDSMVPGLSVALGATAPSLGNFVDATGQVYLFNNNQDDTAHFTIQLQHNYKEGTSIYPHVHWTQTAATGAGTNVVWEFSYTWANPASAVFPAWNSINVTNGISTTNWWHQVSAFSSISGTGKEVSSVIVGRIRRLASSATADDYDQDVAFIGFDIHYELDSLGSPSEFDK